MSEHAFLLPKAKRRATEAIRAIESQTSAEVVVSVRHSADRYVRTSLIFGGIVAVVALVVMLVSPRAYDVRTMPLDALVAFALAALACHFAPGLKRLMTSKARRQAAVERRAQAAFAELDIAKTRQRSGILVFVTLFERSCVVVTDEGIPTVLLGEPYASAIVALTRSVSALDFEAFLGALGELGPILAGVLPRRPDDENELCDDVA